MSDPNPESIDSALAFAASLADVGKHGEAIDHLAELIRANPECVRIHRRLVEYGLRRLVTRETSGLGPRPLPAADDLDRFVKYEIAWAYDVLSLAKQIDCLAQIERIRDRYGLEKVETFIASTGALGRDIGAK